jgi:NhaA family Na+:H+ antiporter
MSSNAPDAPPLGFLSSDRRLARLAGPVVQFLRVEAAGGVLLLVATVAALIWANSPWESSYQSLWSTEFRVTVGSYEFAEDLGHLVNDLLMAFFFLVVGMEIKREIVAGELNSLRAVALPAMAALGGMVVPAAIFAGINLGGAGARGWGIPMATDIAFALGIVALLGSRVPSSVKVLLLTLAIVDDIGAIVVIAVFYSDAISPTWLAVAAVLVAVMALLHRLSVMYLPVLVAVALALWLAVYESGVHATIAGVVVGLLTPASPRLTTSEATRSVGALDEDDLGAGQVHTTATSIKASVSDCDRGIHDLHPWTSFVIVPLFALANAGIDLSADSLSSPSAVLIGVVAGLVLGKLVGIAAFSWLAVRLGIAELPPDLRWMHVIGVAAIGGVGFTVSLFIAGLALDGDLLTDAKIGILTASLIAGVVGAVLLARAGSNAGGEARL